MQTQVHSPNDTYGWRIYVKPRNEGPEAVLAFLEHTYKVVFSGTTPARFGKDPDETDWYFIELPEPTRNQLGTFVLECAAH